MSVAYDPQNPAHTTLAAQALYVKLQKLSEDIQLQHSILNAQKETVLKSRQRIYFDTNNTSTTPPLDKHAIHTHADTVMQHRAMIHKHYDLIRQHKQMVKEQGAHVQNLSSTLLNIQQETDVVDELMNTRMTETNNKTRAIIHTALPLVNYPFSPDITKDKLRSSRREKTVPRRSSRKHITTTTNGLITTNADNETSSFIISGSNKPTTDNNSILVSITSEDNMENNNKEEITSITLTTTSLSTISPSSCSSFATTVSSVSTTTITSTNATTTTTTTFTPQDSNNNIIGNNDCMPLPLSP